MSHNGSFPPLLILRHGETEWNRDGRLQGDKDSVLTQRGRGHALRQGEILRRFDLSQWQVYASPLGRVQQTHRIALPGYRIQTEDRLREIGLGDWAGQLRDDLARQHPFLFESDDMSWYDHAPKGEGIRALEARVSEFLSTLTAPSVLFTHGITSRVIRCVTAGLPAEAFASVEGGQGVVFHMRDGKSERLV